MGAERTGTQTPGGDVIVIKRSWLNYVGVALIFYLLGGLTAYLVFGAPFPEPGQVLAAQQPQQPSEPPARLDNISLDDDPFLGPADAPITIVEFSDFRCGFCRRFHQETFGALVDQYGAQVRFVYRDFPVVGGQQAAEAAECADEQGGFWDYHDALFANPESSAGADSLVALAKDQGLDEEQFRQCLTSGKYQAEVSNDYNDGLTYGVRGTPTFFINGVRVVGAQPLAAFQAVIDEELGR